MTRVITYGTFDVLHYGHMKLLERAKALGDYLIVGITADDFDKRRGKINVQQSLTERIDAVRSLGLADEIIVEEYEGQKIDDIQRFNVDIFTVGSDWAGHFDYLNEYCKVIYLPRTEGISSTEIREEYRKVKFGIVGDSLFINKIADESEFVNGLSLVALMTNNIRNLSEKLKHVDHIVSEYDDLLNKVDAVYIFSRPDTHYEEVKKALLKQKHVICESPIALEPAKVKELFEIAGKNDCILQEAIKTAYSTAYSRMLLLLKENSIGEIVSVDSVCTSLDAATNAIGWNSINSWGPIAMLPVFQILGTKPEAVRIVSLMKKESIKNDVFTKISFEYPGAVASIKVGTGVKSEGELVVSGTKGYAYVPAPWWKTDYFELRYEDQRLNKRFFYQLDGEGIRYELVAFLRAIKNHKPSLIISEDTSMAIANVLNRFAIGNDMRSILI